MNTSRADLVAALRSLTESELAEVIYEAVAPLSRDGGHYKYDRWCLAQASFDESLGEEPFVELVALPARGYPHTAELYEQGSCVRCGTSVVTGSKLAVCPVCSHEVSCT